MIMFLRSAPALFSQSSDAALLTFLRANSVSGALQIWSILCMAAAIYLGATSLPAELRTKTIITVLARPVHRWELLVGKWLGVSAFAFVTLCIGVMLALGLARYLGVDVDLVILRFAVERRSWRSRSTPASPSCSVRSAPGSLRPVSP